LENETEKYLGDSTKKTNYKLHREIYAGAGLNLKDKELRSQETMVDDKPPN